MRRGVSLIFGALVTLLWLPAGAQDARGALDAAVAAMGASTLSAVEYSAASGNAYALGQAPGPGKPWPRFTVTRYSMQVNYDAPVMREQTVRIDDEKPPRPPEAKPLPWSPHTANFYENIQRLKLDVAQMVHVHGGTDPIEKLVAAATLPH